MTSETSGSSAQIIKRFVFTTENFASCFNSPAGDVLSTRIYTRSINYLRGEFHYSGKLWRQMRMARCDIGITVPDDNNILFKMTDINLPCRYGWLRIYESTNSKKGNRRLTYCENSNSHSPRSTLLVLSNTAVVTFLIKRFSRDVLLRSFSFSAVPKNGSRSQTVTGLRLFSTTPGWTEPLGTSCCLSSSTANDDVSCSLFCSFFSN